MRTVLLSLALVALSLGSLTAQQTTPSGVIHGRVVAVGSAKPVGHAHIVIAPVGGTVQGYRSIVTDAAGGFSVGQLPAGTYRVFAQRDGFLQTEYGKSPAGAAGIPVVVNERERSAALTIAMTPTGVIAGRVLEDGRPVRRATVRTQGAYALTDDRGEYRLFDLAPGFHIVTAQPPWRPRVEGETVVTPTMPANANGNRSQIVQPLSPDTLDPDALVNERPVTVFYPGTTDRDAALPVTVRAGEVIDGIDLVLVRVKTFRVQGRVQRSAGQAQSVAVRLMSADGAMHSFSVNDVTDSFTVSDVPPGRYRLAAQSPSNVQPGLFGRMTVTVDRDTTDLLIPVRQAVPVRGRLLIDGQPPTGPAVVNLDHATPGPGGFGYSNLRYEPDGGFVVENVEPADYLLRVSVGRRAAWIKSARFAGLDVVASPLQLDQDVQGKVLELDVSTATSTVDAMVVDERGRPATGVLVVAVRQTPRGLAPGMFPSASTGADGRARLEGLAPGAYTLFATADVPAQAWQDPAVVRANEGRGISVRVQEGGAQTVHLRLIQ